MADDGGALLGPVVDPLRLGDGHVDASVRAGVAEAGAPRRPVEGVARVEVGHPGNFQRPGYMCQPGKKTGYDKQRRRYHRR